MLWYISVIKDWCYSPYVLCKENQILTNSLNIQYSHMVLGCIVWKYIILCTLHIDHWFEILCINVMLSLYKVTQL